MSEDRGTGTTLKGRLADVYVPALVGHALPALSRRLGHRATIDDPTFGRASTLASIDALLERMAAWLDEQSASYRHVASATGIDRDVCEGVLTMTDGAAVPIAVVAERRRLREIELRVYYATRSRPRLPRLPLVAGDAPPLPAIVAHVVEALRKGAVERVLAGFEESSRLVDPSGAEHAKRDGGLSAFASAGRIDLAPTGIADDGRTCVVEGALLRSHAKGGDAEPATMAFERGDSGLLRELRLYYEP